VKKGTTNMSEFCGDLIGMDLPDGRNRLILFDFLFVDNAGLLWPAFRGNIYDGATIPRWAWTLFGSPYTEHYRRAAAFHDVAYMYQLRTRLLADRMLKEAAIVDGTGKSKACLMEQCVRLAGQKYWDDLDQGNHDEMLVPDAIDSVPSDIFIPVTYQTALKTLKAECADKWTDLAIKAAQR